jgi:integrase
MRTGPETYERKSDADKALAVRSIGAEGLHFHDLRHTGNTFAAARPRLPPRHPG